MGDGSFLQDQVFVGDLALADHIGGAGQIQVGDAAGRVTFRVHIQRAAGHIHPDVFAGDLAQQRQDRKSTRLNSSHGKLSRMPSSA